MIDRQQDAPQQQQQGQPQQTQAPGADGMAPQAPAVLATQRAPQPITDWASI